MWRYCEKISDVIWYCESQCERNSSHIVTHIVKRLWENCERRWIPLLWWKSKFFFFEFPKIFSTINKIQNRKYGEIFTPKVAQSQMSWTVGDAQNLEFEDNSFDAYTIAFGIRNVVDIDKALTGSFISKRSWFQTSTFILSPEFALSTKSEYSYSLINVHVGLFFLGTFCHLDNERWTSIQNHLLFLKPNWS